MSVESARAFLEMADGDKELQEQLKGVDSEDKFFAIVKAAGKAAGFEFGKEEWIQGSKKQRNRRVLKALWNLVGGGHPFPI